LCYNYYGETMFDRIEILVKDKIELIKDKTVLIIGLGGVGGYALESLVRSGIGKVIIVDNDRIDITNLNRQIISLNSTIKRDKVDVAYERMKDINPSLEIIKIKDYILPNNIDMLFEYKIDYVIDACDTILTKKELIRKCLEKNIKFISSMGTGKKIDPTKLKIMDIRKTSYDPIAKIIRNMVKKEKIKGKVMVVCSDEKVIETNSKEIGSMIFVPATAGILCANYVIRDIVGEI